MAVVTAVTASLLALMESVAEAMACWLAWMPWVLWETAWRFSSMAWFKEAMSGQPGRRVRKRAPTTTLMGDGKIRIATSLARGRGTAEMDDAFERFTPIVLRKRSAPQSLCLRGLVCFGIEEFGEEAVDRAQGLGEYCVAGCIDVLNEAVEFLLFNHLWLRDIFATPSGALGKVVMDEVDNFGHARGVFGGGDVPDGFLGGGGGPGGEGGAGEAEGGGFGGDDVAACFGIAGDHGDQSAGEPFDEAVDGTEAVDISGGVGAQDHADAGDGEGKGIGEGDAFGFPFGALVVSDELGGFVGGGFVDRAGARAGDEDAGDQEEAAEVGAACGPIEHVARAIDVDGPLAVVRGGEVGIGGGVDDDVGFCAEGVIRGEAEVRLADVAGDGEKGGEGGAFIGGEQRANIVHPAGEAMGQFGG